MLFYTKVAAILEKQLNPETLGTKLERVFGRLMIRKGTPGYFCMLRMNNVACNGVI